MDMKEKQREWQRQRKINGGPRLVTIYEPPKPAPVDNRNWFERLNDRFTAWWKRVF